jgi:hypothetical protein
MHAGKVMIAAGVLLVALGIFFLVTGKAPPIGKLPGDFRIERDGFRFYFPLGTSLLVSALVTFFFWLFRR